MRLPKRGFKNPNRLEYCVLNLDGLQKMSDKYSEKNWTLEKMISLGLIGKGDKVKILGRGALEAKLAIEAHACSDAAQKGN